MLENVPEGSSRVCVDCTNRHWVVLLTWCVAGYYTAVVAVSIYHRNFAYTGLT